MAKTTVPIELSSTPSIVDNGNATAITIDSSENVGIGVTPSTALDVNGVINVRTSGYEFGRITTNNVDTSNGGLTFQTISSGTFSERMRIDSSGNVGIGTTPTQKLDVRNDGAGGIAIIGVRGGTSGAGAINISGDGTTYGSTSFDLIQNASAAYVYQRANLPLIFGTANAEHMRIDTAGKLLIGTTVTSDASMGFRVQNYLTGRYVSCSSDSVHAAVFNRNTNDGELVSFRQDGTGEGSITVSGTTVSYNGGHLSRWSQLADNTKDETIVKGTVMTNLNQMAEWTTDGVTEDNEQLNCMAVSSVEGDVNVAGVFVNWDNDDKVYTADMNVAMTGDMVIRIAQGITVAQGDLLMSAGDGTAKPQDDDIIRAKTIAKVTSTHVSHTYDDGSYLVPCVLMAC